MVYIFLDKKSASLTDKSVAGSGVANNKISNPLLENFKKEKFIQDLKIIFGLLI